VSGCGEGGHAVRSIGGAKVYSLRRLHGVTLRTVPPTESRRASAQGAGHQKLTADRWTINRTTKFAPFSVICKLLGSRSLPTQRQTDRQTDRPRYSNNGPRLTLHITVRPDNKEKVAVLRGICTSASATHATLQIFSLFYQI